MANAKISNDSIFVPKTNITDVDGLAGFKGSGNVKISGSNLITSLESNMSLSNISGTLSVAKGGTGAASFTANGILIGNTINAISATAELANGELLIGSTGNAPVPATLTAGTGVTVTNGAGSITIDHAAVGNIPGTNNTTLSAGETFTAINSVTVSAQGHLTAQNTETYTLPSAQNLPTGANPSATISGTVVNGSASTFMRSDAVPALGSTITIGTGGSARGLVDIEGGNNLDAQLRLNCSAGTHAVVIEGPDHLSGSANYIVKLPHGAPALNKILKVGTYSANAGTYADPSLATMVWADDTDTDTSIYAANGALTGARVVTMAGNDLTFNSTGGLFTIQKNLKVEGQSYGDITSVSNATVDWDNGNIQSITLPSGASTYTPTNPQAGATYILKIIQPSAGDGTITWGSSVKWPGATAPTLTASNAAVDVVTLIYDGTNYLATSVLNLS